MANNIGAEGKRVPFVESYRLLNDGDEKEIERAEEVSKNSDRNLEAGRRACRHLGFFLRISPQRVAMARHGTSHHTTTPPLDPFIVISACTFFSFRCLFSQRYTHSTTMAEQRKAVIKNADMSEPMQQDAVDIASVALSKYNIEKVSKVLVFVWSFWIESFSHILLSHMITGCCSIHQEGIRQEARSNVVSQRDGQFVFLKIDWARL
jgi:hypothetical protein